MRKLRTADLNRLTVSEFRQSEKLPVVMVLDNIRSHHNIGSMFRSADAFRISEIHLCGITAIPPHREIHKTALGATESVAWLHFPETVGSVKLLKASGYRVFGIEQTSESIRLDRMEFPRDGKLAVVFGNEVRGIDEQVIPELDGCIEIPQFGTKHSLNVSVAAGIVLWQIAIVRHFT